MKLRNLIFALFLAIGAIGFTACTGDDGAQGPQGEQGEQGEKGDTGDPGTASAYYDFLKSWGSATGEVACDDPLLTGEGPLPGDGMVEMKALTANDRDATNNADVAAINVNVAATCNTALFDVTTVDLNGDGTNEITTVDGGIGLYKTARGTTAPEMDRQAGTEFSRPAVVTTSKKFVEGVIAADMSTTGGTDEPIERILLNSNCPGVGTAPSAIRGMWRAVEITASKQEYGQDSLPVDADDATDGVQPQSVTTTTKVCVRLDSHPGVTKCYVKDGSVMDATMDEMIAIYDGEALHTVVAENKLRAADDTQTGILFSAADGGDFAEVERLCNLFDEGVAAN